MQKPLINNFNPQRPIVKKGDRVITQGELIAQAKHLAQQLPQGDHYINLCQCRHHFLVSFCAAIIKHSTTLLPPNRQADTVNELCYRYKKTVILKDTDNDAYQHTQVDITELLKHNITPATQTVAIDSDSTAVIAFTSGSTGKPSAVIKSWKTLTGTAESLAARFTTKEKNIVATVPSQHMYGLEMTTMMALYGQAIINADHPFYPQDIISQLKKSPSPKILITTPIHLKTVVNSHLQKIVVEHIISATAPLEESLAEASEHFFSANVEEIYGCTEGGSLASRQTTISKQWTWLKNISATERNQAIHISATYLDNTIPLHDQLKLIDNEKFLLLGRPSDLINVAGKRTSIAELNHKFMSIIGITDAHFFIPEHDASQINIRPSALVVSDMKEYAILQQASKLIDPVFLPRPLHIIPKIPRNGTGKVTKKALNNIIQEITHE